MSKIKDQPLVIRPDENDDNLFHIDKDLKDEMGQTINTQTLTLTEGEMIILRDSLNVILQFRSLQREMA